MIETDLVKKWLAVAAFEVPQVRLFRRQIINQTIQRGAQVYQARAGIAGQCDVYGITRGGGHIEVEAKAAKGKLREQQEAWREWCEAWGVPYMLIRARAGEHPDATVGRWCVELQETLGALNARREVLP